MEPRSDHGDHGHGGPEASARARRVLVEVRIPEAREASFARVAARRAELASLEIDDDYEPVPVPPRADERASLARSADQVVVIRATVDEQELEALRARPDVVDVYDDAPIAPFAAAPVAATGAPAAPNAPVEPYACATGVAVGTLADVARRLGAVDLWAGGHRGHGIEIGIVDGGITATGRTPRAGERARVDRVVGGWPEESWGTTAAAWSEHGNMTATDVLGIAPEARLLDMRISDAAGGGAVSNALRAYDWALRRFRETGAPHVLSNSWGIYARSWDPRYATEPDHPFTRKVVEAIDAGMLVLFAAGNCGQMCPDRRCERDTGPGTSIWGANGHPRVITVGATTIDGAWVGYSSQGPAALSADKPDVCASSHFRGYHAVDTGTSAACPVAAGIVALLKQAAPELDQDTVRDALRSTARDIGPAGWDPHTGAGIVDARRALALIRPEPAPKRWTPASRLGDEGWFRGVCALARDGGVDVFTVTSGSALRRLQVDGDAPVAGMTLDGVLLSPPVAVARKGTVDVVAVGDDCGLWRKSGDGRGWGRWQRLGSRRWLHGAAAAARADGSLVVFAVGTDSVLYQLNEQAGVWSALALGGTCFSAPSVIARPGGRLEVVVIGIGSRLYSRAWDGRAWGAWRALAPGRALYGVAATAGPDGRAHLVAVGTDSRAYHAVGDDRGWSDFTAIEAPPVSGAPAVAAGAAGLDLFLPCHDGRIHRARHV